MKPLRESTKTPDIYKVGDNLYEVRINAGKHPTTGKRQRPSQRFHGSYKDAKAFQAEWQKTAKYNVAAITGWTGADLAREYWKHVEGKQPPNTIDPDKCRWGHIKGGLESRRIRSVTALDLDVLLDTLEQERGIAPQTVNLYRSLLSSMWRQAKKWGAVDVNVVKETARRTPRHVKREAVDANLVGKVMAALPPKYADFVELTLLLGARRGEVCALTVGDYTAETRTISINKAVKGVRDGKVFVGDTKAHNQREFKISDLACQIIERRIEDLRTKKFFAHKDDYLFSADAGVTPWKPGRPSLMFTRTRNSVCPTCDYVKVRTSKETLCPECNVELGVNLTIQNLRRLATTTQLRSGMNSKRVQYRGGWKDAKVMLAHYADHNDEDDDDSNAALESLRGA